MFDVQCSLWTLAFSFRPSAYSLPPMPCYCSLLLLLLWTSATALSAQDSAPAYPRINLATSYSVETNWPRCPPGVPPAAVAGIAIDKYDNVWIYTRTNPVVQVYAPDGHYLFGWRNDNPATIPHFIRIDREGAVWMADVGLHVVTKRSPEDKLLLKLGTEGEPGEDASHFNKPTDVAIPPNGAL